MIDFNFSEECYNCSLCAYVCPVGAIQFSEELEPVVDKEKCINCNKCEKACLRNKKTGYETKIDVLDAYVCRNKKVDVRKRSSSGGVFYEIANYAVELGWYVCGCIYDDKMLPKHIISNQKEDIIKMLGSKYVTSNLTGILSEIKKKRETGFNVLFSGTPCQIAMIKDTFPQDEGIFTVSVACHGTISVNNWCYFLMEEERKHTSIVAVNMREKGKGWLNYGLKIKYKDGSESVTYRNEDGYFLQCFTRGLFERERCLTCEFKGTAIHADIIIADAWGAEKYCPEIEDPYGVSAVLCKTHRGYELLKKIFEFFDYRVVTVADIINNNQRLISPAPRNRKLYKFRKEVKQNTNKIQEICQKYTQVTTIQRLKKRIRKIISLIECCS